MKEHPYIFSAAIVTVITLFLLTLPSPKIYCYQTSMFLPIMPNGYEHLAGSVSKMIIEETSDYEQTIAIYANNQIIVLPFKGLINYDKLKRIDCPNDNLFHGNYTYHVIYRGV